MAKINVGELAFKPQHKKAAFIQIRTKSGRFVETTKEKIIKSVEAGTFAQKLESFFTAESIAKATKPKTTTKKDTKNGEDPK